MQDDNAFAGIFCRFPQPFAQFQFLSGKQLLAETADLSERRGLAKNKRPGKQASPAAGKVPEPGYQSGQPIFFVHGNGRAACQALARINSIGNVSEQFRARMGIRIHEQQPVSRGCVRAAISGPGDLVDRLKYDCCTGGPGDLGRFIGGIVVTNDKFGHPSSLLKCLGRQANTGKRLAEQSFFVKCRHNDGNLHGV